MPYYATSDLQARLGQQRYLALFDRDRDGTADATMLTSVYAYTKATVDALLAKSHAGLLPFDGPAGDVTPPQLIKDLAIDIAIGRCAEAFPGALSVASGQTSPYSQLKSTAIKMLQQIATDSGPRLATGAGEPIAHAVDFVSAPSPTWSAAATSAEADPDGVTINGTGGRYSGF